jgi:hypothetical protein
LLASVARRLKSVLSRGLFPCVARYLNQPNFFLPTEAAESKCNKWFLNVSIRSSDNPICWPATRMGETLREENQRRAGNSWCHRRIVHRRRRSRSLFNCFVNILRQRAQEFHEKKHWRPSVMLPINFQFLQLPGRYKTFPMHQFYSLLPHSNSVKRAL